jgi:DNA invertase Pin-like site-specific DNA recombinase
MLEAGTRVGLYARVSTHDQQTLPMQINAMREYAERRGWRIELSVEDIGSGVSQRPKREELVKAALRRKIDVILVWRLDRWGRSLLDLVGSLKQLTEAGVGFISLTEALDLTHSAGRALAGMLSVFSEFERDILRERVRAGIAANRKRGNPHGRPATVQAQSSKIKKLFAEGLSKREIAKRLNVARSSIRGVLSKTS